VSSTATCQPCCLLFRGRGEGHHALRFLATTPLFGRDWFFSQKKHLANFNVRDTRVRNVMSEVYFHHYCVYFLELSSLFSWILCFWLACVVDSVAVQVLIFSQMTSILDILVDYCYLRGFQYSRLDGSMSFSDREENVSFGTTSSADLGAPPSLMCSSGCLLSSSRWPSSLKILRCSSSCWAPEPEDSGSTWRPLTPLSSSTATGCVQIIKPCVCGKPVSENAVCWCLAPPVSEPPGRPAGSGPLPPNRADQTGGRVPAGHGQHNRPEDPGEGLCQEEAGADGHPQEWVAALQRG